MTVQIKDNKLIIVLEIKEKISSSGKSLVIATTNGNKLTEAEHNGERVTLGVNAYIPVKR